jgi:hypothetical protein
LIIGKEKIFEIAWAYRITIDPCLWKQLVISFSFQAVARLAVLLSATKASQETVPKQP